MLDDLQMSTLEALVDTVIPPDDDPGGWEAGVGDYLLRQFDGDLAQLLPGYRRFLDRLERDSLASCGASFASLSLEGRTELLCEMEREHVPDNSLAAMLKSVESAKDLEGAAFFARIVEHCGEGFYSDPGNGGNRDGVAWRMVGFEVTA